MQLVKKQIGNFQCVSVFSLMWARQHCRISPPHFLAECCKRRLNQGRFVWLCFRLFAFTWLCFTFCIVFFLKFVFSAVFSGGTAAAVTPPFRPGNPALCGSRPLVTPYYCRLGDLLCSVFMFAYCVFDLSVYYLFLQYFDTVGWVFWPVKTVSHITYTVLAGT